jgi:hypothetical protein
MTQSTSTESENQERHGLFVLHPGPDERYDASNYLVEYVTPNLITRRCIGSKASIVLLQSTAWAATHSKHGQRKKVAIYGCETLYQLTFLNHES